MASLEKETVSALCVNLGHGSDKKVDGGEIARADQVLKIIRKRVAEIHPDVVFTQDTFADKNLRKMQEEMNNNVPCSEFSLNKVNINQADSVTIFVNTQRFEVLSVDKEARMVLDQQRSSKLSFLEETRYVVLQAVSKRSGEKMLLSSFHGKWKAGNGRGKASNEVKDELIRDFLTFMDLLAKRLKLKVILIGTDINREMKNFTSGLSRNIAVFDYNYPDSCPSDCKRKSKPVIDYFLHSPAISPIHNSARRFHEDTAILDHHPIHTVFQIGTKGTARSGDENVVTTRDSTLLMEKPSTAVWNHSTQSSTATQRVSTAGKDEILKEVPHVNQPRRVETSTGGAAHDIIPGLSLSGTIGIGPETQGRNSKKDDIVPGALSGVLTGKPQATQPRRAKTSAESAPNDIIPGLALASTIGLARKDSKAIRQGGDTQVIAKEKNKTSAHTAGKMKQKIEGTTKSGAGTLGMKEGEIVAGILVRNPTFPIMQRAFSTKASQAEDQQKLPKPSDETFSCELCRKSFSSRQGLFIHFGKQEKHLACKHKESREQTCLRVFDTELKLSRHKKSHK